MRKGRQKHRVIILTLLFYMAGIVLVFTLCSSKTISESERRRLAQKPKLTAASLTDKSFMEDMETYLLDHFPFRDGLRRIKAYFAYDVLRQKENNDIYVVDGYASKLEYPLDEASVRRLAGKMTSLKHQYFPNQNTWYAMVPDKNYFLAEQNGYPSIDYTQMTGILMQELEDSGQNWNDMDISSSLDIGDYYRTDTHWRQEQLFDTAAKIGEALGVGEYLKLQKADFEEHAIENFYGVYYGQAALPMKPDTIIYLTDETIEKASVWNLEENILDGKVTMSEEKGAVLKPVYRLDKLTEEMSLDKYDVFLGGASSIQVIQSPLAATDKRLIIFRDSYTSSLAPLFLEAYREITLVDLRYISSDLIGEYVDFSKADILFLYSTAVVNHAAVLK